MAERGGVVQVIIKARDLASTVVGRFRRNLSSITRTARDVTRAVAMWTVAMAAAVLGLEKLTERGSKYLAVQRTFAKLTGDQVKGLDELSTAAKGTIADFTLMALHNQALALGSAKTTAEFAEQIRITRILARAQGLTATEGLEKFTVGMARLSRLRLDDLGITLKQEEANDRYAATIGKAGDELDEGEKKIAFRTEAMRQATLLVAQLSAGEEAGTEAADRFGVAMKNLGDKFAIVSAQSPAVTAFFDSLTGIALSLIDIVGGDTDTLIDGMKALGRIMGDALAIGINEGLAAMYGGGGPGDRMMRAFFAGNVEAAKENLKWNLIGFEAIAKAAEGEARARQVARSPAGLAVANRRRQEEIELLERRRQLLIESNIRTGLLGETGLSIALATMDTRIEELRAATAAADKIIAAAAARTGGEGGEEEEKGFAIGAGFEGDRSQLFQLLELIRQTRTEIRGAELEAFLAPTEEAAKKATDKVNELGVALAALETVANRFGGESLLANMFAQIPGVGDPNMRFFDRLEQGFRPGFERDEARMNRLLPFGDTLSLSPASRRQMLIEFEEEGKLEEAAERMKTAQAVTVSAMSGMAAAAIRGSQQTAQSVVNMITQIGQSLAGGGILGSVIGGFGGILSAVFGKNDPMPVRVDDYGTRALSQMKEVGGGPIRITTIIEQGGVEIERIERELLDRTTRDENIRFGASTGMGS